MTTEKVHVAVVGKDGYGNSYTSHHEITELQPGVETTFGIHAHQELRVYETEQELIR